MAHLPQFNNADRIEVKPHLGHVEQQVYVRRYGCYRVSAVDKNRRHADDAGRNAQSSSCDVVTNRYSARRVSEEVSRIDLGAITQEKVGNVIANHGHRRVWSAWYERDPQLSA